PYRLSFAYAGEDQQWQSSWRDPDKLPAMIRLTVQDTSSGSAISTVAAIHVQPPAKDDCKQPQANGQPQDGQPQEDSCGDDAGAPANAQGGSQQSNPSATAQGGRS